MSGQERDRGWRLLVACARHAAGLADANEVGVAASVIDDWDVAERFASAHGLLPWLARGLSAAGSSDGACVSVIASARASQGSSP